MVNSILCAEAERLDRCFRSSAHGRPLADWGNRGRSGRKPGFSKTVDSRERPAHGENAPVVWGCGTCCMIGGSIPLLATRSTIRLKRIAVQYQIHP